MSLAGRGLGTFCLKSGRDCWVDGVKASLLLVCVLGCCSWRVSETA